MPGIFNLSPFPTDLFLPYIEDKEPTATKSCLNFDDEDELQEITDFRNNTLYQKIALNLHKTFPQNKKLAWAMYIATVEKYCPSIIEEANGLKEVRTIFESASKSKIANETIEEEVIPEKLFTTLEELEKKDIPEPKFLVDGKIKIPENTPTTIFGPTNQCKSFFLESLFIPWSKGENAFGTSEITTIASRILLVPTEHSAALEKKRFKYLGGLGNPNIAIYDRADKLTIESEKEVNLLLNTVIKGNFDVVVVDLQSDIHSGDDSSAKDVNKLIQFYKRIIALGKTPIGVAHTKKGETNNLIDAIRGSGDIGNKSACAICIRKTSKTSIVVESAKSRSSEPLAPIALEMIIKEGQVAGFKYVGEAKQIGAEPSECDKAERIIVALMENLKTATTKEIKDHTQKSDPEIKPWAINSALKKLTEKKVLKDIPGGARNTTTYTLIQD